MTAARPADRYLAIDVLRGATVALMIVVNMSISEALSFGQLLHSQWDGFTLTDAVFPTFLFVTGASLAFTAERYARDGAGSYFRRAANRSLRIFLCGLVVSNFPFFTMVKGQVVWETLDTFRVMGVLQRIALTYFAASALLYFVRWRGALLAAVIALVAGELIAQAFGDHSLTGSAAARIDTALLGARHLYQLEGAPFDPEGLLGVLPGTANVLAGYLAVTFLRGRAARGGASGRDLAVMAAVGAVLAAVALALAPVIPINKKLWTASYTLLSIGIDVILLAVLVQVIDRWRATRGTGYFAVFGKNALVVYMVAELAMALSWAVKVGGTSLFMLAYNNGFAWIGGKWGSLALAILFTQACWLFAWVLDRKRIYIKL